MGNYQTNYRLTKVEFENITFQSFLKCNNIHFFTIKSQFKAALAEQLNSTLKEKLWKYFSQKGTY